MYESMEVTINYHSHWGGPWMDALYATVGTADTVVRDVSEYCVAFVPYLSLEGYISSCIQI